MTLTVGNAKVIRHESFRGHKWAVLGSAGNPQTGFVQLTGF